MSTLAYTENVHGVFYHAFAGQAPALVNLVMTTRIGFPTTPLAVSNLVALIRKIKTTK